MSATKKQPSSAALAPKTITAKALANFVAEQQEHPLGALLIEDLAAAKMHGRDSARVGIAEDGNPIIYGCDEHRLTAIGAAMTKATAIHTKWIPKLNQGQFDVLAETATQRMIADELPMLEAPPASSEPSVEVLEDAPTEPASPAPSSAGERIKKGRKSAITHEALLTEPDGPGVYYSFKSEPEVEAWLAKAKAKYVEPGTMIELVIPGAGAAYETWVRKGKSWRQSA